MNKQRLAVLIAAGIGAIATFMPWVQAPLVGTIPGTKGDGWITLGLFAVAIIITLLSHKSERIEGMALLGVIVPPLIAAIIGLWKIFDFNSKMASVVKDNLFAKALQETITIEYGLYLVILSGIAVPILAYIIKDNDVDEIYPNS